MSREYPLENMSEVKYEVGSFNISQLEGKILTQIDAIAADATQRKALKDIFRAMVWDWAYSCMPVGSGSSSGGNVKAGK